MPEWWTYGLSDFLLFSPRTYYRLLQRHNEAVWPAQLLTLGLGVLILGLLRWPSPRQGRIISAILALLWAWVAWAFLRDRYASINWAATYLVPVFAAQSLLLWWLGTIRGRLSFGAGGGLAQKLGIGLLVLSLAGYPILAPLSGRPWRQAEIFGIAADPTALATLGLLLVADGRSPYGLLVVPLLWCLFSGATLWAMGSPEAWLLLAMPVLVPGAVGRWRAMRRRPGKAALQQSPRQGGS